jgi:carboxymethylenebutenolidase
MNGMRSKAAARFVALVVAAAAGVFAAGAAGAGSMVDVKSGGETIQAYLAVPEGGGGGAPALVVIQEWWGLNDWVKKTADRFAAQGYVTIAPDLYRGKVAADPEYAHELMRGLPDARAIRDVRAAAAYVKTRTAGPAKRVGVIGFCMGGRLSQLSSLDRGPFDVTVMCYGSPETDAKRLKTLRGPLLGVFGGADRGIGDEQTSALRAGLKQAGRRGAVTVYPGAGHAFLNDTNASAYSSDQAPKAWAEIDAFLAKELAGKAKTK